MADWQLAFAQIAHVAGELIAVREAGFTEEALKWPRSEKGIVALCAFNGISREQAPPGWRYYPNKGMKACWERVIAALSPEPPSNGANHG
jgi:hypothetical protein